ncbi:hypothetical protein [Flavobacterium succinicans]|uniref:Outer membrane protein beta-barrel domain-containing protein n=1 Tax=Flavobacterium succinicans TaxID=29536 RepID=A0A199XUS4_9FLAO|nr:hypothetical protein [Flavobacterium succinicans]OAZ05069.1 hypothetical protein FLB_09200 [Flavobacterium succinicans]
MKTRVTTKMIITLSFFAFTILTKAQNASVEKSTYGIQTGVLGIWVHREVKLANQIALRAELGMNAGIWGGNFYPKTGYLMTPVITLEPRWYYNLEKRQAESKSIAGNSGNYLTIQTSYHPNWITISNYDNVKIVNQLSIIPTWGIKRNIGQHFTYETGIGFGYRYYFAKSEGYTKDESSAGLNLHLRIGYRF